jgi:hypothetical protein
MEEEMEEEMEEDLHEKKRGTKLSRAVKGGRHWHLVCLLPWMKPRRRLKCRCSQKMAAHFAHPFFVGAGGGAN